MLLPEDFYLATVLNQNVESPCTFNETGLCRSYGYPNITFFDRTFGVGGYVSQEKTTRPLTEFYSDTQVGVEVLG